MTVPLSKTARFQSAFYEKPSTEYNYWFSTEVQNYQFLSLFWWKQYYFIFFFKQAHYSRE